MSQQESEGKWKKWTLAGVVLALLSAGMSLALMGGMLHTRITAPNFGLLALCLHGAGWEGDIEGDPDDSDEEDEDAEEGDQPGEEDEDEDGSAEGEEDEDDGSSVDEDEDADEDAPSVGGDDEEDSEGESGGDQDEEQDNDDSDLPSWIPEWWLHEDAEEEAPTEPGEEEEGIPPEVEDLVSGEHDFWDAPGGVTLASHSLPAPAMAPAEPSQEGTWVPEDMLELYEQAGEEWDMDWTILAGVAYEESRHGTDPNTETENDFGALGPMQFIPSAWEHHGVYPDGREGTPPLEDRLDPATAVWSAANKLTDQGVRDDARDALHQYNRSWVYVDAVMSTAEDFRNGNFDTRDGQGGVELPDGSGGGDGDGGGDLPRSPGSGTEDDFEDCWDLLSDIIDTDDDGNTGPGGIVAQAPDELTQQAVDFALDQRGKPYVWGGNGSPGYDCSGLTQAAYREIGLSIPRVTHDQVNFGEEVPEEDAQPGDLIFFNTPQGMLNNGPNPRHVGMVVDGEKRMMVEAWCTSCGPIATRTWEDRDVHSVTRPLADPAAAPLIDDTEATGDTTTGQG